MSVVSLAVQVRVNHGVRPEIWVQSGSNQANFPNPVPFILREKMQRNRFCSNSVMYVKAFSTFGQRYIIYYRRLIYDRTNNRTDLLFFSFFSCRQDTKHVTINIGGKGGKFSDHISWTFRARTNYTTPGDPIHNCLACTKSRIIYISYNQLIPIIPDRFTP